MFVQPGFVSVAFFPRPFWPGGPLDVAQSAETCRCIAAAYGALRGGNATVDDTLPGVPSSLDAGDLASRCKAEAKDDGGNFSFAAACDAAAPGASGINRHCVCLVDDVIAVMSRRYGEETLETDLARVVGQSDEVLNVLAKSGCEPLATAIVFTSGRDADGGEPSANVGDPDAFHWGFHNKLLEASGYVGLRQRISRTIDGDVTTRLTTVLDTKRGLLQHIALTHPRSVDLRAAHATWRTEDGAPFAPLVEYLLADLKFRWHEIQLGRLEGDSRRVCAELSSHMEDVNALASTDASLGPKLAQVSRLHSEHSRTATRMRLYVETMRLNGWIIGEASKAIFANSGERGCFAYGTLLMVERGILRAQGRLEYEDARRMLISESINLVRAEAAAAQLQLDKRIADEASHRRKEHEGLAERLHLLELFIVGFYSVELWHAFHKGNALTGLAVALIGVGITSAYIFNWLKPPAGRASRIAVTIAVCLALVLAPWIANSLVGKQAGLESKDRPGVKASDDIKH